MLLYELKKKRIFVHSLFVLLLAHRMFHHCHRDQIKRSSKPYLPVTLLLLVHVNNWNGVNFKWSHFGKDGRLTHLSGER